MLGRRGGYPYIIFQPTIVQPLYVEAQKPNSLLDTTMSIRPGRSTDGGISSSLSDWILCQVLDYTIASARVSDQLSQGRLHQSDTPPPAPLASPTCLTERLRHGPLEQASHIGAHRTMVVLPPPLTFT